MPPSPRNTVGRLRGASFLGEMAVVTLAKRGDLNVRPMTMAVVGGNDGTADGASDLDVNRGDAVSDDPDDGGRSSRQIDDAATHKGSAIIDAYDDAAAGPAVGDTHQCAEGQPEAGGSHGAGVECLATCS